MPSVLLTRRRAVPSILQSAGRLAASALIASALSTPAQAADPYRLALERFRHTDPQQFLAQLEDQQPEPPSPRLRAEVVANLPREGEVTHLTPTQQLKLHSLTPILIAHRREGVYLLKVVKLPEARLALYARFVVLISTTALDALSPTELQAALAHEIGHEYVWDEYDAAVRRHDSDRLRELELFCDGFAVVTLARLGLDASIWGDGLRHLYARQPSDRIFDDAGYPSLEDRRRFVNEIAAWLRTGSAARSLLSGRAPAAGHR